MRFAILALCILFAVFAPNSSIASASIQYDIRSIEVDTVNGPRVRVAIDNGLLDVLVAFSGSEQRYAARVRREGWIVLSETSVSADFDSSGTRYLVVELALVTESFNAEERVIMDRYILTISEGSNACKSELLSEGMESFGFVECTRTH